MKSRKTFGVVFASLAVLAMSLPVWSQDTTQSTTTTTQTPSQEDEGEGKDHHNHETVSGTADSNHNDDHAAVIPASRPECSWL